MEYIKIYSMASLIVRNRTLAATETVAPILHHGLEYKGISALVGTGAKAL